MLLLLNENLIKALPDKEDPAFPYVIKKVAKIMAVMAVHELSHDKDIIRHRTMSKIDTINKMIEKLIYLGYTNFELDIFYRDRNYVPNYSLLFLRCYYFRFQFSIWLYPLLQFLPHCWLLFLGQLQS